MWPRRRRHRVERTEDRSGIERAESILARVEADDAVVDAVAADHARIARRDDFGETIARALRLRRET